MRKVRIDTVYGSELVACVARGRGLALTRAVDEDGWTITHLADRSRLGPLVGLPLRKARAAFALAISFGPWPHFQRGHVPQSVVDAIHVIAEMVRG